MINDIEKGTRLWLYHIKRGDLSTTQLECTGTLNHVLIEARRIAAERFGSWFPGEGPVIVITEAITAEKRSFHL